VYEEFFKFSGSPFRLAPDPKFFYGSKSHNKAMAYLHYGLRQAEGFIVITGEIGAGKSMLIGHLLDQLDRSNVVAANLATPNLAPEDLLSHVLSAFRVEPAGKGKAAEIEAFEDFLFDQMNHGRRVLLIVDEAQNLPPKTLEELRVLSNLEYEGTPLFQVFLVGQPDFRDTMARGDMEQLRQRVIATYHLLPIARAETEKYIEHRLRCVGWDGDPKFTADAYDVIHAATGGLPRKIHKLCNRALLYCSVEGKHVASAADVNAVLADMAVEQSATPSVDVNETAAPAPAESDAGERSEFDLDAAQAVASVAASQTQPEKPAFRVFTVRPIRVEPTVDLHAMSASDFNSNKPVEAAAPSPAERTEAPVPATSDAPPQSSDAAAPATSVFDRLRAKAKPATASTGERAERKAEPPRTATLDEVANAIAAARPARGAAPIDDDVDPQFEEAAATPDAAIDDLPPVAEGPGWKHSVVMSINDTREELKRANQSVARLRRKLSEIDKRRSQARGRIAASLDRADALLADLQRAWR
jgi:putative secretion ATPase (PEP-CTERM system associated)